LAGCLIIVGLVAVGCAAFTALGNENSGPTDVDAKIMCERFVKDRLKSPGSADFSEENDVTEAGGSWTVSGVVDSQNSFGALLRNQFSCTVKPRPDGKTWDLVSLTGLTN
jgi:hypothetical protein